MKKYSDEWIESGMASHDDVRQLRDNWHNAQQSVQATWRYSAAYSIVSQPPRA